MPDILTSVQDGGFVLAVELFGASTLTAAYSRARTWSPSDQTGLRPELHVAPLRMLFLYRKMLPQTYRAHVYHEHGVSWDKFRLLNGYKVSFVAFKDGKPVENGKPQSVITGFVSRDEKSYAQRAGRTRAG